MQHEDSVRQRIRRFGTLMGVLIVVSGGVLITQRLSDETLALLSGLTCGVGLMIPLMVLAGWTLRQQAERLRERSRPAEPPQPVVVVMPPMLPGYTSQERPAVLQRGSSTREFTIVGEE
ncbi:MAG: hypothetical protein RBT47_03165 [Anaerolineae bacterium]|jgi:hypothetical protein|nr:hypothetical protein [Anaerolineae bacterium]